VAAFGRSWPGLDNFHGISYCALMAETATPELVPGTVQEQKSDVKSELEPGYLVICWNDPVNYMDYVTHVFQRVFGWPRKRPNFICFKFMNRAKAF